MNEKYQQIYNYFKTNKLTDLDANAFYNAYSDPSKSKEIWSYLKQNKMTDLDENSFYASYFGGKKKEVSQSTLDQDNTSSDRLDKTTTKPTVSSSLKGEGIYTIPGQAEGVFFKKEADGWYKKQHGVFDYKKVTDPNRIKKIEANTVEYKPQPKEELYILDSNPDALYKRSGNKWMKKVGSNYVPLTGDKVSEREKILNEQARKATKFDLDRMSNYAPDVEQKAPVKPIENKELKKSFEEKYGDIKVLEKEMEQKRLEELNKPAPVEKEYFNWRIGAGKIFDFDDPASVEAFKNISPSFYMDYYDSHGNPIGIMDAEKMKIAEYNMKKDFGENEFKAYHSIADIPSREKLASLGEGNAAKLLNSQFQGTNIRFYQDGSEIRIVSKIGEGINEEILNEKTFDLNYSGADKYIKSFAASNLLKKSEKEKFDKVSSIDDLVEIVGTNPYKFPSSLLDGIDVDTYYSNKKKVLEGELARSKADTYQKDSEAFSKEVESFNTQVKGGKMSQQEFETKSAELEAKRKELESRRRIISNTVNEAEKIDNITNNLYKANVIDSQKKEQEGSFLGVIGRQFGQGLTNVSKTALDFTAAAASLFTDAETFANSVSPGSYQNLKNLGYTDEEIKNETQKIIKSSGNKILDDVPDVFGGGTTKEYVQSKDRGQIEQAVSALAESIGTMAGGAGLAPGSKLAQDAAFFAMSYNAMEDQMRGPAFDGLSENEKKIISLPYGLIIGQLEKYGAKVGLSAADSPILNAFSKYVMSKVFTSLPKNASLLEIKSAIDKSVAASIANGMIKIVGAGFVEGGTEFTQQVFEGVEKDIANKIIQSNQLDAAGEKYDGQIPVEIVNQIKENKFFKDAGDLTTYEGISNLLSQSVDAFNLGFLAGGIGGAVDVAIKDPIENKISNNRFKIYKDVVTNDQAREGFISAINKKVDSGELTRVEADNQIKSVNDSYSTMMKIPNDLSTSAQKEAFSLMSERNQLEKQIAGKDPSLVAKQKDRVAEIDQQLKGLSYAVQERSTEEVLPREPETTGEAGGQREGMGQSVQGEIVTEEGQTTQEEKIAPKAEIGGIIRGYESISEQDNVGDVRSQLPNQNQGTAVVEGKDGNQYAVAFSRKGGDGKNIFEQGVTTPRPGYISASVKIEENATPEQVQAAQQEAQRNLEVILPTVVGGAINPQAINDIMAQQPVAQPSGKTGQLIPTEQAKIDDIERRRQETLKSVPGSSSQMKVYVSDGNNRDLTNEEQQEVESFINQLIEQNKTAQQIINYLTKQGYIRDVSVSPYSQINYIQGRIDGTITTPVNSWSIIKDINKKYDAELAALEQENKNLQETKKETNLAENETEKPKAGNRLFNEPIKAVAEIANRYFQRVFGSQRPTFEGTTDLDVERAKRIADAYEAMENNPNDPEVRRAYDAMAKETIDQYQDFLDAGYVVEINNEEPYANSADMIEDLRKNKRIRIFSTEAGFGDDPITPEQRAENPLLATTEFTDVNGQPMLVNDLFRAVHDFFGHAELGNSFGPKGEENAWNVHSRMYSPLARRAMTTETRGQNSYVNFSGVNERVEALREEARKLREEGKLDEAAAIVNQIYDEAKFADQKIGLLPIEFSEVDQDIEETVSQTENELTERNVRTMSVKYKRNPIVRAAVNVLKALPGVKIYLHENADQYVSALANISGKSKQSLESKKTVGSYIDGEIHLDMSQANLVTLLHEAFHHALVVNGIKGKYIINMAKGLRDIIKDKDRLAELDEFVSLYEEKTDQETLETRADEFVAQLGGILAANQEELTTTGLTKFKALINKIFRNIGLGNVFTKASTSQDAVNFINAITRGFNVGEDVSGEYDSKTGKIKRQAVTVMEGKESMKKFGLDPGRNITRKIGEALEARQRAKYGTIAQKDNSPEARKKISNWMVDEVKYFVGIMGDKSGKGWYGELYQNSLDAMSKIFPEMKTDQNARDLFTMLVAITSDGQKVMSNFKLASEAYDYYKKNGVMPDTLSGLRVASFEANLKRINELLVEYKGDIAAIKKDLMDVRSIQDINKERKTEGLPPLKTSWPVSFKAPFAASVFGPKLGMFFSNLSGNEAYPTLDRWWSRTFNRYRGTLIPAIKSGFNKKGEAIGLDRFKSLLGNPGMSNEEALLASKSYRDSYAAKGYKNGTEVEKAANTIYKTAFENINDAPFNGGDRQFMYDTISDAVNKLNKEGYELSIADVQAILWYFEKNLYKTLGVQAKIEGISYEDAANYTYDKWKESGQKFNYEIKAEEEGQAVEDADEDIEEENVDIKPEKKIKFQKAPKILGQKPTKVIVNDEAKALIGQIKLEIRAQREQKKAQTEVRKSITDSVKALVKKGSINLKQASTVISTLNRVNLDNPEMVKRFNDYVAKVFDKAEYIDKVDRATKMKNKIKKNLKGASNPFAIAAKGFSQLNPKWVEDIDDYMEVAQAIYDSVRKSQAIKGVINWKKEADFQMVAQYVFDEEARQTEILLGNLRSLYERITGKPSDNVAADVMQAELKDLKVPEDFNADVLDQIEERLAEFEQMVEDSDPEIVKKAASIDPTIIPAKESIRILDALDTYFTNESIAGLSELMNLYIGKENVTKFKGKAKALRSFRSKKLAQVKFEQSAQLNMILERKFRTKELMMAYKKASGIQDIENGANKAEAQAMKKQKEYLTKFGKVKGFRTAENIFQRGALANLLRTMVASEELQQEEFDRNITILRNSVDTLSKGNAKDRKKADVYKKVLTDLGVFRDDVSIDMVLSKAKKENIEAVNFVIDMFADIVDPLSDLALGMYNQILTQDINYTPYVYKMIDLKKTFGSNQDNSGMDFFGISNYANQTFDKNKAGILMPITRPKNLTEGMHIDLDFDNNMFRQYRNALVDLYTAGPIRQFEGFFNSEENEKILGSNEDLEIIKGAMIDYVRTKKGSNYITKDGLEFLNKITDYMAQFGAARALVGVGQFINQFSSGMTNTIINAGEYIRPGDFSKEMYDFMANSGRSIANVGGNEIRIAMSDVDKSIEAADLENRPDQYVLKFIAKENMRLFNIMVAYPDAVARMSAWMAYYRKSMVEQGLLGFTESVDTTKMNDKAADYAQMMVDRNMDATDAALRGSFFRNRASAVRILRSIFFPFSSFGINQKNRMWNDLNSLFSGKDIITSSRSLVSIAGEQLVYNSIRYYVAKTLLTFALSALGYDDDDQEELYRKLLNNTKLSSYSKFFTDIVSPAPVADYYTLKLANMALKGSSLFQADQKEVDKYVDKLKQKGNLTDEEIEDKKKAFEEKNARSFYIDTEANKGSLSIQWEKASELTELFNAWNSGEYTDDYNNERFLSKESRDKLTIPLMMKFAATIYGTRELDQIANKSFKIVKDVESMSKTQNESYAEVKKELGRDLNEFERDLIKTKKTTETAIDEIKFVERNGGLRDDQKSEYLKLLEANPSPTTDMLRDIQNGMKADQIIKKSKG